MKYLAQIMLASLLMTGMSYAQGPDGSKPQGVNLHIPEGWTVRFDNTSETFTLSAKPDTGDIYFVNMTPGWHITTGPRAIFYHEDNTASGNYTLSSKIYLFDTQGRDREGFGLFIGGQNLDNDQQEYLYFLLRNTGEYLIKLRKGDTTETIVDWSEAKAMNRFTSGAEDITAENKLTVQVQDGKLSFLVNDELLTSLDASGFTTEGQYGLRVNHAINLHVANLILE